MRRILLVLSVMAVMAAIVVVMAAPAFAKAQHFESDDGSIADNPNPADCRGTLSASGNENTQCSVKEPGSNKGGSGGGGANAEPQWHETE